MNTICRMIITQSLPSDIARKAYWSAPASKGYAEVLLLKPMVLKITKVKGYAQVSLLKLMI